VPDNLPKATACRELAVAGFYTVIKGLSIRLDKLTRLTLVSRGYCHLCQDMELALRPIVEEFGLGLKILDVDEDPVLEARYGEWVPVLLHEGVELCHYFLEAAKVRDYLSKIR
jgi:thioredoxin reductase (NADPH)